MKKIITIIMSVFVSILVFADPVIGEKICSGYSSKKDNLYQYIKSDKLSERTLIAETDTNDIVINIYEFGVFADYDKGNNYALCECVKFALLYTDGKFKSEIDMEATMVRSCITERFVGCFMLRKNKDNKEAGDVIILRITTNTETAKHFLSIMQK